MGEDIHCGEESVMLSDFYVFRIIRHVSVIHGDSFAYVKKDVRHHGENMNREFFKMYSVDPIISRC